MNPVDQINPNALASKFAGNPEDIEAITSVIQTYAKGGRLGDAAIMQPAFRQTATIHGYIGGALLAGPINLLFDWVAANPPAPELEAGIADVDLAETVATARVEIADWFGYRFTDQFTLLKENGAWSITSKVFHTY